MRLLDPATFNGPIARATLRTSFVLGIRLLVQAGTLLLVARMLGPQQFGAFAGVAALALVLGTLSTFGTHLVLLGEVSQEPARCRRVMRYAIPSTLMCGSALLITYLLITSLALGVASIPITVLVAIGVAETLVQPLFSLPATEHLALGRTARSQLLTTLPLALRLAAAVTVFLLHPADRLAAYSYGYLLASLIALLLASATMQAPWPAPKHWRFMSKTELRHAAGYAALAITATSPAELDKTLATRLLPLGAAGLYAAGARVIGAAALPVVAMMLSALPRLFREGQNDPRRTTHLLRWVFGAALLYSTALAAVLWLISPGFAWLFGSKYQGIEHTVRWLCLAVPGMALRLAAGNVLMALGRPWMRVGFEASGVAILVIAAAILTASFDATGMTLALACSECGMAAIGWAYIFTITRK
jgi:O-antigen/teichoic acid export membrane protein